MLTANFCWKIIHRIIVEKMPGKCKKTVSLGLAALTGTVTNTVLVLGSLQLFGGFTTLFGESAKTLDVIIGTLISTNGLIELVSAVIVVPVLYMATEKYFKSKI